MLSAENDDNPHLQVYCCGKAVLKITGNKSRLMTKRQHAKGANVGLELPGRSSMQSH